MKKILLLLIVPVIALAIGGCAGEEVVYPDKKTPVLFSTENISSPENVRSEYYSPDPHCLPLSLHVWANCEESELTIKCTTFSEIALERIFAISNKFISTTGSWNVQLVDSNKLVFSFSKIEGDDADEDSRWQSSYDTFKVLAKDSNGQVSATITVTRYVNMTEPLPG